MEDYRQSEEYCQYFCKKKWSVEKIGPTRVLVKKIPFIGSVIKIQRCNANTSLEEINKLAKRKRALFVVIEPNISTENSGYKLLEDKLTIDGYTDFSYFFSPTKTAYIDLTSNEEEILNGFDSDIKKTLAKEFRKTITFKTSTSFDDFYKLLAKFSTNRHLYVQNLKDWKSKWQPFGNQLKMIFAYDGNVLLGANMFIVTPPFAYGIFLPTTHEGRKNHVSADLIWEGLKLAKDSGCTQFDLNGMYDERYNTPKDWVGLTTFKKKFKGHVVEFMRSKVKIYSTLLRPFAKYGMLWVFLVDSN